MVFFGWIESTSIVPISMALGSIIATWLVMYSTQRRFKDPIVKLVLGFVSLVAMNVLISFAILRQVDVYLCVGTAIVFGLIGWLFAAFATLKPAKKVVVKRKKKR